MNIPNELWQALCSEIKAKNIEKVTDIMYDIEIKIFFRKWKQHFYTEYKRTKDEKYLQAYLEAKKLS